MKTRKNRIVVFIIVIIGIITACDNNPTPAHTQPVANAGDYQTVTLANILTITLDGTGSTGNISVYAWECASYTADQGAVSAVYTTAQVNTLIANAGTATETVAPRKAGTYVFKLTVTDNDGESDTDNVTVVVKSTTKSKQVTVAEIPTFAQNSSDTLTHLGVRLDGGASANYSLITGSDDTYFSGSNSLNINNIFYTLISKLNGVATELSATVLVDGKIPYTLYTDSSAPVIIQTFYYGQQEIGRRAFEVRTNPEFSRLYAYDLEADEKTSSRIYSIPSATLTYTKDIAEID